MTCSDPRRRKRNWNDGKGNADPDWESRFTLYSHFAFKSKLHAPPGITHVFFLIFKIKYAGYFKIGNASVRQIEGKLLPFGRIGFTTHFEK